MTNWEAIRKEFETSEIAMKDLAEKHNVKASTLRSRKNREAWSRDGPKNNATQQKKNVATQRKKKKNVATHNAVEELNNSDLTEKQKQFCLLYLQYFNATKAYKEAYEVDYKTANANGSRMIVNASIKKELARLKKAQQQELFVNSLDIKKEWVKQAFADMTDFVEFKTTRESVLEEVGVDPETGEPMLVERERAYSQLLLKHSDDVDGTVIQEVKQGRDGVTVKLYDKQKAMSELMKHLGEGNADNNQVVIINNSNDDRMKKWVEENGGL